MNMRPTAIALLLTTIGTAQISNLDIEPTRGLEPANLADVRFGDLDADGLVDRIGFTSAGLGLQPVWDSPLAGRQNLMPPGDPSRVELRDIDGDGFLDLFYESLFVGGWPRLKRVVPGATPGVIVETDFATTATGQASDAELADLDGDGDLDMVVCVANVPQVFEFAGGSFQARALVLPPLAQATFELKAGDFDGDGDVDALVGNYQTPNKIYVNRGEGFFDVG